MAMFYGLSVESGSKVPVDAQAPDDECGSPFESFFEPVRAVLIGGSSTDDTILYVENEFQGKIAVAVLNKATPQCGLELRLPISSENVFCVEGPGTVHLSGMMDCESETGEDFTDGEEDDDDDEEEEEAEENEGASGPKSAKLAAALMAAKKHGKVAAAAAASTADADDDDDEDDDGLSASTGNSDDEEEEEGEDVSSSKKPVYQQQQQKTAKHEDDEGDDDEDSDEVDGEESDEDEDEDDDEVEAPQENKKGKKAALPPSPQAKMTMKRPAPSSPAVSGSPAKKEKVAGKEGKEKKVEFASDAGHSNKSEDQLKDAVVAYLKKNGACTIGQLGAKVTKPPALKQIKWGQFLRKHSTFKVTGQNVSLAN